MEINKQAKYEGYIWYSDQAHPQILRGKEFDLDQLKEYINPFVIEGQLWDAEHGISVSIRNIADDAVFLCDGASAMLTGNISSTATRWLQEIC